MKWNPTGIIRLALLLFLFFFESALLLFLGGVEFFAVACSCGLPSWCWSAAAFFKKKIVSCCCCYFF
jgi:hypothetical protein